MVGVLVPAMVTVQGVKEQPSPGIDMQISMNSAIHDEHFLVQSFSPPPLLGCGFLLHSQVKYYFFSKLRHSLAILHVVFGLILQIHKTS